ncbi:MAG TPA: hypothetical protein VGG39_24835 [Polyangiaceae bacterium]|jgi:tetratricopeptide (TPR) repeat protein
MKRAVTALVCAASACVACVHPGSVERAYGGDVVEGRFVSPAAYAAFLRGALAEAEGHGDDAVDAYVQAAHDDPASPEPWARIAHVSCGSGGGAGAPAAAADAVARGEAAARRAVALDDTYAPAWVAVAECAAARGDASGERAAADRALRLDPRGDDATVLLARSETGEASPSEREALVALTVTAHDPRVAWGALARWAEAHGDVALWTRALVELARVAPDRRTFVASAAEQLAGEGYLVEARAVAAAALDADRRPLAPTYALAPRLAIDEAIARDDGDSVRRRAVRGHVSLEEAAGRALLAGRRDLARDLASELAAADPGATGARLVLAAAGGGDLRAVANPRPGDAPASAAALVAFGVALLQAAPASAPEDIAALPHEAVVPGDDPVVRPAVELVSRKAAPPELLPPDGRVELAALTGTPAPSSEQGLDARHRYLALALTHPGDPATRTLAARLHGVASVDPVVAAADALQLLGTDAIVAHDAPRLLLARNPADPLLAAVALRLAEKVGDRDVARRARETLTAMGLPRRAVE